MEQSAHDNLSLLAALDYATKLAWHVFPVDGKTPATAHGFRDASADPMRIAAWYDRRPHLGVAVATGAQSGLLVVDLDGTEGTERWRVLAQRGLPKGPLSRTPGKGGGFHAYFRYPGQQVRSAVGLLGPGVDIRADGGYVVVPPSPHPAGGRYEWVRSPLDHELPDPPRWLLDEIARGSKRVGGATEIEERIGAGQRNTRLMSIAGTLRRRGLSPEEILSLLVAVNEKRCDPPLPAGELERIAVSVGRYQPEERLGTRVVPPPPQVREAEARGEAPVDTVVSVFRRWLYLPDPSPIYVTAAAMLANMADGDPVWLMLVAPPGSGKTEILNACSALPGVFTVSTLTGPAALLSGTSRKDSAGGTGGLLRRIGDSGILILKDFTSILTMHRERRGELLGCLREIYDGRWERELGTDGGKLLSWEGKLGLVAGVTPAIDSHANVMSSLGERFVYYRFVVDDPREQAAKALEHFGREHEMREELQGAITHLFERVADVEVAMGPGDMQRLVSLATFTVLARSAVERENYQTRTIESVPPPEAPARIVGVFQRMLIALRRFGLPEDEQWKTICRLAADSVPAARMQAFLFVHRQAGSSTTSEVSAHLGLPTVTVRRILEDLAAHRVLLCIKGGEGRPDRWSVHERIGAMFDEAFAETLSEMSVDGDDSGLFSD